MSLSSSTSTRPASVSSSAASADKHLTHSPSVDPLVAELTRCPVFERWPPGLLGVVLSYGPSRHHRTLYCLVPSNKEGGRTTDVWEFPLLERPDSATWTRRDTVRLAPGHAEAEEKEDWICEIMVHRGDPLANDIIVTHPNRKSEVLRLPGTTTVATGAGSTTAAPGPMTPCRSVQAIQFQTDNNTRRMVWLGWEYDDEGEPGQLVGQVYCGGPSTNTIRIRYMDNKGEPIPEVERDIAWRSMVPVPKLGGTLVCARQQLWWMQPSARSDPTVPGAVGAAGIVWYDCVETHERLPWAAERMSMDWVSATLVPSCLVPDAWSSSKHAVVAIVYYSGHCTRWSLAIYDAEAKGHQWTRRSSNSLPARFGALNAKDCSTGGVGWPRLISVGDHLIVVGVSLITRTTHIWCWEGVDLLTGAWVELPPIPIDWKREHEAVQELYLKFV
jgi:hypothetical protein